MARVRCLAAFVVAISLCAGVWLAGGMGVALAEASKAQSRQSSNVFEKFTAALAERPLTVPIIHLFRQGQYKEAELILRRYVAQFPTSALYRYNLAAALARQGKAEEALASLTSAVEHGFDNAEILQRDPDFNSLRNHPQYRALVTRLTRLGERESEQPAVQIRPATVSNGRAVVDESNTTWDPRNNLLLARFAFEQATEADTAREADDEAARLLNRWVRDGEAAGNRGDLYDNRDRGHSRLSSKRWPQLAHIQYGVAARAANVDYGVNPGILFNAITIGNSSTALTSSFAWRSQARMVLTSTDLITRAYLQYASNHLYVYPEHRDHDAAHGDLMPANTPYMIISQGSSGSDQPFLNAVAGILAAFHPKVKDFIRAKRLVAPTVQMVLRRGQGQVSSDGDYLSAKAHPSVFSSKNIDLVKMLKLANRLEAESIPPAVVLSVPEESKAESGIDYFAPPTIGERLFDTPSAIARVVRSTAYSRRIVVDASGTRDPNGRALSFHWVVLRGDPSRVNVKPIGENRAKAALEIAWHERRPVPFSPELTTDRVDIGVFAYNGVSYSAPAFVTFLFPGDQKRSYDAAGRIGCIDYADREFRSRYVDPMLYPQQDWRDCYEYDRNGKLAGWNRVRGGAVARFTRHGAKVVETDAQGRPTVAERVRYELETKAAGRPSIVEVPTGSFLSYHYSSASDLTGTLIKDTGKAPPNSR
jgi:tetratricopeptide (TPR) repeat protein